MCMHFDFLLSPQALNPDHYWKQTPWKSSSTSDSSDCHAVTDGHEHVSIDMIRSRDVFVCPRMCLCVIYLSTIWYLTAIKRYTMTHLGPFVFLNGRLV